MENLFVWVSKIFTWTVHLTNLILRKYHSKKNNLGQNKDKDCVYVEIQKAIHLLPQEGILQNKFLKKHLKPHKYYTLIMWHHTSWPVAFT